MLERILTCRVLQKATQNSLRSIHSKNTAIFGESRNQRSRFTNPGLKSLSVDEWVVLRCSKALWQGSLQWIFWDQGGDGPLGLYITIHLHHLLHPTRTDGYQMPLQSIIEVFFGEICFALFPIFTYLHINHPQTIRQPFAKPLQPRHAAT